MAYNREGYAPWSLTRKAGVQSATVDGDIEVPQYIQPTLDTGFVDFKGDWKGRTSSDDQFRVDVTHEAVANGATVLSPQATPAFIDMTGFNDLFIALKPTTGGNFAITAVMGPDTNTFANLSPVNAASVLRGASLPQNSTADFQPLFEDAAQATTTDVWQIFILQGVLAEQKNLQFKIVNNTGTQVDLDFAFMRIV